MYDAGVNAEELAGVVSVAPRTIFRWRNGTGQPDALQLRPMADHLRVDVSLFVDPPELPDYPLAGYRLSPEEVATAAARLAQRDQQAAGEADPPAEDMRPSLPRKRASKAPR